MGKTIGLEDAIHGIVANTKQGLKAAGQKIPKESDLYFTAMCVVALYNFPPSDGGFAGTICGLIDRKYYPQAVNHTADEIMEAHMKKIKELIERW